MTKVLVKKKNTLSGHTDCVYALAPGHAPEIFFSAGGDGMVVSWDLTRPETGNVIATLPNSIYALHCLKERGLLVVGHNYEGIHLLDWRAKKEVRSLKFGPAAIFDIQSYENDLIVASGDGTVTIVDIENWSIKKSLNNSDKSARALAVNHLNGEIAVGYSDHSIRVFDLKDYSLKFQWVAHQNSVFTLAYDSSYQTLLSGSRDARLKAWNSEDKYSLRQEVVAHLYAINSVVFGPDGKHFVTCSLDKSIKVWEAGEVKLLKVIDKARHAGHGTSVNKLLWTSFDNSLVSASDDRTISVWDIEICED